MKYMALLTVLAMPAFAQDGAQFQTPSGNIHCVMYGDAPAGVRCDVIDLVQTYTAPPPDCDLDYGSSFYVDLETTKGELYCHGDTIILPTMSKLAYGDQISVGGITCMSERSGQTCVNPSGAGFTLTRARQTLF
jgi:hypothetical protein